MGGIKKVQEDVEGHCVALVNIIEQLPRKLLDYDQTFLPSSEIVKFFKYAIPKILEDDMFSLVSLDTIFDVQIIVDNLKKHLEICNNFLT
jgi:hypothetical protein